MTITPESLRRNLADGAAAGARAARSSHEIVQAAEDRHAAVSARLDELRPLAQTDAKAADEYGSLIGERGQLNLVLGNG